MTEIIFSPSIFCLNNVKHNYKVICHCCDGSGGQRCAGMTGKAGSGGWMPDGDALGSLSLTLALTS